MIVRKFKNQDRHFIYILIEIRNMVPKWKRLSFFVKFLKNQNIKNYTLAKSNKKLSLKKYVVSFFVEMEKILTGAPY